MRRSVEQKNDITHKLKGVVRQMSNLVLSIFVQTNFVINKWILKMLATNDSLDETEWRRSESNCYISICEQRSKLVEVMFVLALNSAWIGEFRLIMHKSH